MAKTQEWQKAKARLKYYTNKLAKTGFEIPSTAAQLLKEKPKTGAEKRALVRKINVALKQGGTVNRASNLFPTGTTYVSTAGEKINLTRREIEQVVNTTSKLGFNPLNNPVNAKSILVSDKSVGDVLNRAKLRTNPEYLDLRAKQFVYNLVRFADHMPEPYRSIWLKHINQMTPAEIIDKAKDIAANKGTKLNFESLFSYYGNLYEDDTGMINNAFMLNGDYMLSEWGISPTTIKNSKNKYAKNETRYLKESLTLKGVIKKFGLNIDYSNKRRLLAKRFGVSLGGENY